MLENIVLIADRDLIGVMIVHKERRDRHLQKLDREQQENVKQHITQMNGTDTGAVSWKVHVCSSFQTVKHVQKSTERDRMQKERKKNDIRRG